MSSDGSDDDSFTTFGLKYWCPKAQRVLPGILERRGQGTLGIALSDKAVQRMAMEDTESDDGASEFELVPGRKKRKNSWTDVERPMKRGMDRFHREILSAKVVARIDSKSRDKIRCTAND
ncbi:hypothetical protein BDZ94DRAFT_1233535 [Collybia nuda]|uniref:Uncharacterized protein n=1 Tax=Collybia nuda TaxID=64659 RepID=A0A9P5YBP1_9AGAR|nr:hypothetical protein BDZ94DRAFT_1233535 [Collybia nuda]